jgi:hypothetical protein
VHLLGHDGLWEKMMLIAAKCDNDNLKNGGPKKFGPTDLQSYHVCFLDSLNLLIIINN